jgi:hypothetical protein
MRSYLRIVRALCQAEGYPTPVGEYVFAPPRRWRFDLAWPTQKIAIEVQGGLFVAGRHQRAAALPREYEKLNAANLRGWCVLLILPEQIQDGTLQQLLKELWSSEWRKAGEAVEREWERLLEWEWFLEEMGLL